MLKRGENAMRFSKAMLQDGAKRMNKWLKKGEGYPNWLRMTDIDNKKEHKLTPKQYSGLYENVNSFLIKNKRWPNYATTGDENTAIISYIYKNSTSNATTYAWAGTMNNSSYSASTTNASTNSSMIRFKGDGKTLSYYVGNRGSSSRGLARNTKFAYIVIYSE